MALVTSHGHGVLENGHCQALLVTYPDVLLGTAFSGHIDVLQDIPCCYVYLHVLLIIKRYIRMDIFMTNGIQEWVVAHLFGQWSHG